ncbi:insulinase family protein [Anaerolinea thermolimosa]|uniref:insulinase family protein n=1 Tax=Anaerolinea thermolimosa TaxID=229919 RepID=UPI00191C83A4|nr:insulinase family protein [Anaerolinea thermolimosa]
MMERTHGFELIKEERLPEVNSLARLYRHIPTGAEVFSLINDDENKVFGVTFRTPPPDSTGLPHIMEHSVLCGSRKYPVKEPFIELAKGSLNTFLNAMTYPDKTCYPVASQNLQDFYNLVDVYLDAVFHPLLDPFTLQQEGWHIELNTPDGEMTYKGVVFNEMKGAYSSPEDLLNRESQMHLYPQSPYGLDSGGDPRHIPDLTYEQWVAFHRQMYHPSNARFYFYGNDDPEKRLEILAAYLKDYSRAEVNTQIPLQPRIEQPRRTVVPYAASVDEERHLLTVSWMLPPRPDPRLSIALMTLEHILIGTPASPLRKALIESGLGEDLTGRGLDLSLLQPLFSVGMKGVPRENLEKVEHLILETLTTLTRDGIDPDTVAASLNTVEFRLRELNTGRFPRGLAIMLGALDAWLYDGDPFSALRIDPPLKKIKEELAQGALLFENLIDEHLVKNLHRVTVILQPDPSLASGLEAAERERLARIREGLSQAELARLVENTLELQRRQETPDPPEALASIPSLRLEDLERPVKTVPGEWMEGTPAPVFYHDLFTNGIVYLDLAFDLHTLSQDLLPLVPLFGRALTETGAHDQSFVQLLQRIGRATGGIHAYPFVSAAQGRPQAEAWLMVRGKAMLPQAGELFSILKDILTGAHLDDRERFRQMVLEEKASLEAGLIRAGHRLVNTRLRAHFDEAGWVNEQMGGVSYLQFLRDLSQQIDRDWAEVQARLERIRQLLVKQGGVVANVTLDAGGWQQVRPALIDFLAALPPGKTRREAWQQSNFPAVEGLAVPSQVNFVGKAGNLYTTGYQLDGSILAILNYLNATWLWERLRVRGGAYGGFATFDHHSGYFSFLSYRDPNLLETLVNYDQTAHFLKELSLSEAELTKAIIGAIGELDAYQLPDAKGFTAIVRHLLGVTDSWRQEFRNQLLETRPQHFRQLAEALEILNPNGHIAILAAQEVLQKASVEHLKGMRIAQIL